MRTAHDMRVEAHDLINEIQAYGLKKQRVYFLLSRKLGIPLGETHLRKAVTLEQLERYLAALYKIRDGRAKLEQIKLAAKARKERKAEHERKKQEADERRLKNMAVKYADELAEVTKRNNFRAKHRLLVRLFSKVLDYI